MASLRRAEEALRTVKGGVPRFSDGSSAWMWPGARADSQTEKCKKRHVQLRLNHPEISSDLLDFLLRRGSKATLKEEPSWFLLSHLSHWSRKTRESMWQLWIVALFPLAALQGVEHDSKEGSNGSRTEFRDGLSRGNKTVPENETSAPWRSAWVVSTTGPLLTGQSSPDYKARRLAAPTITVQDQNGTCQVLLSCAGPEEEASPLNFTWLQVNGSEVLSTAQTLHITQKPQQGVPDYICTIRNQAGESSSVVSLKEHCQDPSIPSKYLSASFYAKYIVPLLIVLVILLVLFLMYRRKRGKEIHSSMESINESSESDNEVPPSVEQMAEVSFLPEGIKSLSQDNTSIAGAESTISNQENASDTRKQLPTRA